MNGKFTVVNNTEKFEVNNGRVYFSARVTYEGEGEFSGQSFVERLELIGTVALGSLSLEEQRKKYAESAELNLSRRLEKYNFGINYIQPEQVFGSVAELAGLALMKYIRQQS